VVLLVDKFVRVLHERSMKALANAAPTSRSKPTMAQVQGVLKNMKKQGFEGDLLVTNDYPAVP